VTSEFDRRANVSCVTLSREVGQAGQLCLGHRVGQRVTYSKLGLIAEIELRLLHVDGRARL
jgi:hypothetical protein